MGVADTEPLRGHGEEQCSQLPQCFPTPNTCTQEGQHVEPLPCGGHQCRERAEPCAGGHPAPASTPHLGNALAGKRAEPCPWMPWTEQGAWAGRHLLPPSPHLPQSLTCSTHGPHPVHPWGAHMAGFALTQQMPAGARAEPLYFPGWRVGASLQASGAEPPRSPSTYPRLPSPALICAAPGSWEN